MNLITLTSVDSTNNYLQQLCEKQLAEEGTVVLSLEQISGKGQRGKSWESQAGMGLYASILLKPQKWPVEKQYVLSKAMAVGAAEYLASKTSEKVHIKWPNDLLINGKKVAGILIENSIRGQLVSSVIAGFGINLNQSSFHESFDTPAASLRMYTGELYRAEAEVTELFRSVWKAYRQLMTGENELIQENYNHFLYKRGERASFIKGEGVFFGTLKEVDDDGLAIIEENGRVIKAHHPATRFYMRE